MKTKLLLATLFITFSTQSFATGTIDCTGKNALNLEGKKVKMELLLNTGYGETSELASDLNISEDLSKNKEITMSQNAVSEFKSNKNKLFIKAIDADKNIIILSFVINFCNIWEEINLDLLGKIWIFGSISILS